MGVDDVVAGLECAFDRGKLDLVVELDFVLDCYVRNERPPSWWRQP